MMPILPAICFIAPTVCVTASPPATACLAAVDAMPSVTLAFSVFWLIEADICSTEAEVSSTLAACSEVAWLMLCAVAETSSDALDSASAAPRTSPMICDSLPVMFCIAESNWPVSSLLTTSIFAVMSPSANWLATPTATFSGRVMLRVTQKAKPKAIRIAPAARIRIRRSVSVARALASSPTLFIEAV